MTNHSIMVQGTGSHVGKSILVCALCRILKQDGYTVAPFKAQNMALNSFVTKDGKEMGRAQVAQAEAAGIEPAVEMNPILLKPTGDCGSQVVVMGKPVGNMTAREYYQKKSEFVSIIKGAYDILTSQVDIVVIEGAGSPAEINLKDGDIVNMGMAEMASSPVLLVTDIDRGGSFAWIVGTLELLTAREKDRVKGIIFNKFRGDKSILKPGLDMLENRIHKPVVGVIPYMHNLGIDDEDSVSLEHEFAEGQKGKGSGLNSTISPASQHSTPSLQPGIDIAIIKLPRISNFTDFNVLAHEKAVKVRFVDRAGDVGQPDLLIIPGTKNTIGDLLFLRERGIAGQIIRLSKEGTMVMGICGGYQMLGMQINDPHHVESSEDGVQGLGLLNVATTFAAEKQTFQVKAHLLKYENLFYVDEELTGYEIHMGETVYKGDNLARPFARISERAGKAAQIFDGCVSNKGNVLGTYIHGIFDNDGFRSRLIKHLRLKKGLESVDGTPLSSKKIKEEKYNTLADIVRGNIDMGMVYKILEMH